MIRIAPHSSGTVSPEGSAVALQRRGVSADEGPVSPQSGNGLVGWVVDGWRGPLALCHGPDVRSSGRFLVDRPPRKASMRAALFQPLSATKVRNSMA